ncbi:MAG: hypothetical protein FJZ96_08875 [Chloroflexi bacterium]|nr:hypothetical protein [Chloroflexota bacterium]
MTKNNRTQLALGLILILVAAWLVAIRIRPDLDDWVTANFDWPFWVIGSGAILLLIGLLSGAPGMAVPASITAGVGGILYYQNASGDWDSWSYMWALIPGFIGIGSILTGILGEDTRRNLRHGLNAIITSVILFLVFATIFGGLDILGVYKEYWMAGLLGLLGIWFIVRGLLRSRPKEE